MPTLIYIHGFLSSPKSVKAQATQLWLDRHRSHWHYLCPGLSSYPAETEATLLNLVKQVGSDEIYLIGSSLGGFWATYLTERFGFKSVLINPAVRPHERFAGLIGQPLTNYHTSEVCVLQQRDIDYLAACSANVLYNLDYYWLLVQSGDETLDYRDAVKFYQGCRQTVEADGNHSFIDFEGWLPELIEFFETPIPTVPQV